MSQSALSFSDGNTALLRDPRQVPLRLRRGYDRAKMALSAVAADIIDKIPGAADDAPPEVKDKVERQHNLAFAHVIAGNPELAEAADDAAILALVASWSYGPVTQPVLEDLPAVTYDELREACKALAAQMSPNFAVSPDPKATSGDSVDSVRSGTVAPITGQISYP